MIDDQLERKENIYKLNHSMINQVPYYQNPDRCLRYLMGMLNIFKVDRFPVFSKWLDQHVDQLRALSVNSVPDMSGLLT